MSSVMIRCPNTGRAVSTAIETEPACSANCPRFPAGMLCPACGEEHVWATGFRLACGRAEPAGPVAKPGIEAA